MQWSRWLAGKQPSKDKIKPPVITDLLSSNIIIKEFTNALIRVGLLLVYLPIKNKERINYAGSKTLPPHDAARKLLYLLEM